MGNIRVFEKGSSEYKNLEAFVGVLRAVSDCRFEVEDVYFDFGQDWKWTTVVCYRGINDSYQVLNPNEHEMIVNAYGFKELMEAIEYFRKTNQYGSLMRRVE